MKPQDILFLIAVLALLIKREPKWFVLAGLLCLIAAIPLFSLWVFFTAQRLVYYAAGFFSIGILLLLYKLLKTRYNNKTR